MKICKFLMLMTAGVLLALLAGCDGSSSSNNSSGSGRLSLFLTDAPTEEYQAVYVTIDEVAVHQASALEGEENGDANPDGWQVVAAPQKTYNLLDLVNGAMENLGTAELDTGVYTQMRLMLKNTPDDGDNILGQPHPYPSYIIDKEDAVHELKVPSGYQTGIKLVHSFEITRGLTRDLILDFDASKSVVRAGNSGNYNLKPTIKVIGTVDNGIVSGTVRDKGGVPLAGASVSAQIPDPAAENDADQVVVATTTLTDENGNYSMYLAPGNYLIVAGKGAETDYGNAYGPECRPLAVAVSATYAEDFQLASVQTGKVAATVQTGGETLYLSFRKNAECGSGSALIEVASLSVSEDDDYTVRLPGGSAEPVTYTLTAYTGEKTESLVVDVSAGEETVVAVDFSPAP